MAGVVGTAAGILGDAWNWVTSIKSNKETQAMVDALRNKNVLSPALLDSLNMVGEQSNQGLPGYENIVSEEKGKLPTTLNQIRDSVSSGNMMDIVTNLYTKQNQDLNQLAVADAQTKAKNKEKLSGFLANELAPAQDKQRSTEFGLTIGKDRVRQQGVKDNQGYLADILGKLGGSSGGNNGWLDAIFGGDGGNKELLSKTKPTTPQVAGFEDTPTITGTNNNIFGLDKMDAGESKDFNIWANLLGYK
jgi:hypothetical protein